MALMRDNRVRFSFNYFIHHLFIFVQSGKKNLKFFCFQNYLLLICFVQLNRLSSEIVRLAESYIQMLIKKLFFLNFSKQHCRTRLKLSAEPNKTSDLRLKLSAKPIKTSDLRLKLSAKPTKTSDLRLKLSAKPNKTSDLRLKLSAKPNKSCD